jgi:hypothetical protein
MGESVRHELLRISLRGRTNERLRLVPIGPGRIRTWIEQHPEALPDKVSDLGRFPMPFRRIMVTTVTPEVRLRLWREHLESFLGPESWLNAEQRSLVVAPIPEQSQLLSQPTFFPRRRYDEPVRPRAPGVHTLRARRVTTFRRRS